jgi:hypothetical protein
MHNARVLLGFHRLEYHTGKKLYSLQKEDAGYSQQMLDSPDHL